jgi:hypothetical protein
MSSAYVDCAKESLLSKPPDGSWRQSRLLNELTERDWGLRVALQRQINCCFVAIRFHANRRGVNCFSARSDGRFTARLETLTPGADRLTTRIRLV